MKVFCIFSGIILLSGCIAPGAGNVKSSDRSESSLSQFHHSASHTKTNKIQVIHASENIAPTHIKTQTAEQEKYDTVIDYLATLPEYIR